MFDLLKDSMLTCSVTSSLNSGRQARAEHTRAALLSAAERLIAEHGVAAVTHRQITKAAGAANNAAVVYYFGTKLELVRAIEQRHAEPIEMLRKQKFADDGDPHTLRGWIGYLVEPLADHLMTLGSPSWYARFAAAVLTDPTYQRDRTKQSMTSPTMRHIADGIAASTPHLSNQVRWERTIMMRTMLMHTCAEFERAFAEHRKTSRLDWHGAGSALIDAIVGLWEGSVSEK